MLFRHIRPLLSPGDQSFYVNGSKTKLVADAQASSVCGPFTSDQASSI